MDGVGDADIGGCTRGDEGLCEPRSIWAPKESCLGVGSISPETVRAPKGLRPIVDAERGGGWLGRVGVRFAVAGETGVLGPLREETADEVWMGVGFAGLIEREEDADDAADTTDV